MKRLKEQLIMARKRYALFVGCSAAALAAAAPSAQAVELVHNGDFEVGTLQGWTSVESNGPTGGCDTRWTIGASFTATGCSFNNRNPANPIGVFAVYSSFDGNGPQTFSLSQGIDITGSMSSATLSWSDSFGANYSGEPRTMTINIIGATTETVYTYTLPFDLPSATSWTAHSIDITSVLNNFVGQNIQLEFLLTIPETETGPAGAGLDNVSLDVTFGVFDGDPPGLTINGPTGTQTGPFLVNFAFSEDVSGFDVSDISLTNASLSGFSGSGASYSATVTPSADGLVSLNVAAGAYEDLAGNDNTAASSFSVQADISAPTVVVSGPTGPVNAPFVVDFDFSENVGDFTLGDITIVNGAASGFTGADASYSATITPNADGLVEISLAAGVASDAASNGNQASNTFSLTADLTAPIITTPGTMNVATDPGLDTAVVSYTVTAEDPGNGALTPTLVSGLASGSAFPIGTTTISYSATDAAGNVTTASFDIVVGDDEDPVIVGLPADVSVDTDPGQATAVVSWTAPTVSDNAPGATIMQTAGPASGSAFPLGVTTIAYAAEDASGNIVTASFDVTVADNEGPAIVGLPADISVDTDAGQPTAVVSWTPPTVSDNAPGASIAQTAGPAPGSAFPVGLTTITYEAADAAGNIATASFTVTVADNEGPVIVGLPADISVDTDAGQPTALVSWTPPTVNDNAPGATITQTAGPAPGTAFPVGVTTITYDAEDASGNTATASFTVTVADNEGPAIVGLPADISVDTDAGQPTAVVSWTAPTVSDNAPGATITQTAGPAPGSAFPVGATTITYEAEDASGNVTTASFTVTVADNEGPSIVGLPADISVDTDSGQPTAIVSWTAPTVSDNAPGASLTQTAGLAPGSAFPLGVTTITYEAQDASGNVATASFSVTVADNEGPSIVGLPADMSVSADPGVATAIVNWTAPTVSDNAPGATIVQTAGPAPGAAIPLGVTTIAYEAQDASGNTASASFTITVTDDEGPAIVGISGDINVSTDPGQATALVSWTPPTVSDNAPGATITQTAGLAPGSAFPLGATTITYEAEDAAGNTATASFTVTVQDAELPVIAGLPADIGVDTDPGLPTAVVSWTPPTVSDNAPGATITQTAGPAPGSAFPVGATTITYQAEDASGNVTSASFIVTVADNEGPAIVGLPADISVDTDAGQPTAVVSWTAPTVSDNAPGATITQTAGPAPGSAFPVGATTITYEAEDASGNVTTASFTVTVADNEGPVIVGLPVDIAQPTDAGVATAVVTWTEPTVSDNAPGATITRTAGLAPGSAFPVGVTTITYEAEDASGNTTTASFNVTVSDGEPPAIVGLPADIVTGTDPGAATAVVNWTAPTVSDNAPGATITQTAGPAPGSAFPVGATAITYEAQDASGNSVTASFTVTVQDSEPPAIVGLPADIVTDTDPGSPTAVVSWPVPTVTDNAPGATITQTAGPAPGSAFPVGTTTISYEAEDAAGTTVTASFSVTVQDAEAPSIVGMPADIVQPTDAGLSTAVVTWTEPTVADNATGATITRTAGPAPGSSFPIGVTTVTYEAQDASGNTVTASFSVTIEDGEAPAIVGLPADIATNTDPGASTAVVTWTPPTVDDNAPGATITQTAGLAPGSAFPIGDTTITYQAQDAAGNTTAASFTVSVADAEAPAIVGLPANISVNTDAGLPTAVVSWTPPTVSDNAAGATIAQTAGPAPGSAFPLGVTTITYQAQDIAGNSVSESFTVTVQDAEPPVFVGFPGDIVLVVDYPATSAVANWTPPTVDDNAPGSSVTQIAGPAPGSSFPLGETTITYRAEDNSGNVVDQSFIVRVTQTAPGSVRLVIQSAEDGSFAFTSPEPDLNFTIATVGGNGDETVTLRPGVFDLAFALPAGFGILSAGCDDSNSALSDGGGTIDISSNEHVTCTIVTVDSVTETSRLIGAFMGARANLITQNMPDSDRRIDRLNGRASAPGGVSAFGLSIMQGDAPFDLSIGENRANFSFSLAGMRAQRAQTRREQGDARARWGDGRFDPEWTQSRGHDFSSFGAIGPSEDPAALAASFGAGQARAPHAANRRGEEGTYVGAAPTASAAGELPDVGAQRVDFWVEGTYAQFDTNIGDGDFYMLSAGVDWLTQDFLLFGFGAQMDWTDMEGATPGSAISGQGYLVGPYMTAKLREGLYFDSHIAIGRSINDVSPFGVYEDEVDAERTYLSAALIGDIRNGAWTFRPEGRVTYFREETDSYVDSIGVTIPSIEVKTGSFEFSPTVRYRYELANESVFTPFASLEGIWTFEHEDTAAFALGSDAFIENGVRGRIEAGFDFVRPSGMRMSGLGFYDGLGQDDFASWGAQVRLSWSFEPD